MKILFIEPNISGNTIMPSLSIAALKSFINNRTSHDARTLDLTFNKNRWKERVAGYINESKPDIVGLSVLSFNLGQSLDIAAYIKKNAKVKIIFGGIHPTLLPEKVINHDEVDYVCVGEGEMTLKELMDNDLDFTGVKGMWAKDGKEIIKQDDRNVMDDLDALPFPDWSEFDMDKFFVVNNDHFPIMASRGCPYDCTYCSNHALKKRMKGRYVRFRHVDNVIREIQERLATYKRGTFRYLFFYDDTFILNSEYVHEFCGKYREAGLHKILKWNVNVRANLVKNDMIKEMKASGCYEVRMGVESANDFLRNDIYKRNMSKEEIEQAILIIKNNGLRLRLQFMIGAPYETREMMQESFDMAKKAKADYILFPVLMPLPCTEINKICKKEQLIEEDGFTDSIQMYTSPVMKTKYLTRSDIKGFVRKVRLYQIRKYFLEGLGIKGVFFIWDLIVFFLYYKPRYKLNIDNAWRFTIGKYNLA